jgi:hypothetical protein
MKKILKCTAALLLPLTMCAMSPVTDLDLADVNSPSSLIITSGPQAGQQTGSMEKQEAREAKELKTEGLDHKRAMDIMRDNDKTISAEEEHPSSNVNEMQTESDHTMTYPHGQTSTSNSPVIVDLKPGGGPQLRIYYTNNATSDILPKSWVDIKPR